MTRPTGTFERGAGVIAFWSAKGGQGTSTVAVQTAVQLARQPGPPVVLVDLAGGLAGFFPAGTLADRGVTDWMHASARQPNVPLPTCEHVARLHVMSRGWGSPNRFSALPFARRLAADGRRVVVDCGTGPATRASAAAITAEHAERSILVTRACGLALESFARLSRAAPTGVVLVREPDRTLGPDDVAGRVGAPVLAEIPLDPAVAALVDARALAQRPAPAMAGLASAVTGQPAPPAGLHGVVGRGPAAPNPAVQRALGSLDAASAAPSLPAVGL